MSRISTLKLLTNVSNWLAKIFGRLNLILRGNITTASFLILVSLGIITAIALPAVSEDAPPQAPIKLAQQGKEYSHLSSGSQQHQFWSGEQ